MEIYRRYGPALIRKCQRMLQSREEAEDVVQGLFVDMLEKGQTEADLPYLFRAVTNRCLNHLRRGDNRRRLLDQQSDFLRGTVRSRCDDQVIGLDLLIRLADRLDRKCREVLVYRYFDDMSQEEIARLVGASRKTVGKRLKKVHKQVRALVGEGNGGGS